MIMTRRNYNDTVLVRYYRLPVEPEGQAEQLSDKLDPGNVLAGFTWKGK